jgi:hypothetical protein
MEGFSLLLSFPVAIVASLIYMIILEKTIKRWNFVSKLFVYVSVWVLVLFLLELACVSVFGPINLRRVIGSQYYMIHLYVFLVATPAMANIFALWFKFKKRLMVGAIVCGVVGTSSALLQYTISNSLFGESGKTGPYTQELEYLF